MKRVISTQLQSTPSPHHSPGYLFQTRNIPSTPLEKCLHQWDMVALLPVIVLVDGNSIDPYGPDIEIIIER
jgi:hypothetical protein